MLPLEPHTATEIQTPISFRKYLVSIITHNYSVLATLHADCYDLILGKDLNRELNTVSTLTSGVSHQPATHISEDTLNNQCDLINDTSDLVASHRDLLLSIMTKDIRTELGTLVGNFHENVSDSKRQMGLCTMTRTLKSATEYPYSLDKVVLDLKAAWPMSAILILAARQIMESFIRLGHLIFVVSVKRTLCPSTL